MFMSINKNVYAYVDFCVFIHIIGYMCVNTDMSVLVCEHVHEGM